MNDDQDTKSPVPPKKRPTAKEVKDTVVFFVKKVGPTAAIIVLRRLGQIRASNALGIGLFAYGIYQEWKKSREKRDAKDACDDELCDQDHDVH